MMKSKQLALLICILLFLTLCVPVSGDPAPGVIDPSLKVIKPGVPEGIEIKTPPWPIARCNPARTGRANVSGPGTMFVQTASADLFSGVLHYGSSLSGGSVMGETLSDTMRSEGAIHDFRIGQNNQLYFLGSRGYALYKWEFPDGQQWDWGDLAHMPIGLDGLGRVQSLGRVYLTVLHCIASDKTEVWQKFLPNGGGGASGFFHVGRKLYTGDEWLNDGTFKLARFDVFGNLEWHSEYFSDRFQAIAEETGGNVYGRDSSPALHKIGTDGSLLWTAPFPVEVGDDTNDTGLGPIVGSDGRIWVGAKTVTEDVRYMAGMPYMVLNPDGSEYKKGGYGQRGNPVAACYGGNNRFYVGFTNDPNVTAYDDWNEKLWTTEFPGGGTFLDMVMDVDDNIYVAYTAWGIQSFDEACYVAVLDPADGSIKKTFLTDIPSQWASSPSELALGDEGKLYLLNSAGYLKEFGRMRVSIEAIRMKPGR